MGHEAYLYRFRLCDVLSTDTELEVWMVISYEIFCLLFCSTEEEFSVAVNKLCS